ncbi:Maltose/maltodextrin ABC transporter, permease protein MalF [Staphylococcus aureus]|uniref:Maltose/maltodextrin ABC transporter, permease protein MalF n=1 Tax=Staphylococcus aureus TaxID=1280 RepID=A0A380EBC3_STAAU|nr:Maltose/maltodextrin ABC transporter, permease protein MalF [Staphylococcus aureus]
MTKRNPKLAALLSVIPGLDSFIIKDPLKGRYFLSFSSVLFLFFIAF